MRLVIKDYLLQLKEKDELDLLLCDLLTQMGYVTDNRPETGNRQYGVDIRAHNSSEILLCVVKQGNIKRSNWDSGENAVRQSLTEIQDFYIEMIKGKDRKKKLHIVVVTNGVIDEATRPSWEGYVSHNTKWSEMKVCINFWGIDELVDYVQKYLFDEHLFGVNMQGLMRKALYFIGEGDYRNTYFERIIDEYITRLSDKDSNKERKKKIAGLYLASQMIAQYAEEEGIMKISVMVTEYLIIRYWKYLLEHSCFEKIQYVEWLPKFLNAFEKWNQKYYEKVRYVCEAEWKFPFYNAVEQRVMLYEVLGYFISYAYYLSFFKEYDERRNQRCHEICNSIVGLINNCSCFPYAPYDKHIGIVSMLYRLMIRMDRTVEVSKLLDYQCKCLVYYYLMYKQYPTAEDSFEDAVNIYMGCKAADYVSSAFWGTILEWIVLLNESNLYQVLQPFLKEDLNKVTKCTWFLREVEEVQFYDSYAMNLAGEGIAFDIEDNFEQIKEKVGFVMQQYENEHFSYEKYSFEALEMIVCRYYGYLVRVCDH